MNDKDLQKETLFIGGNLTNIHAKKIMKNFEVKIFLIILIFIFFK